MQAFWINKLEIIKLILMVTNHKEIVFKPTYKILKTSMQ